MEIACVTHLWFEVWATVVLPWVLIVCCVVSVLFCFVVWLFTFALRFDLTAWFGDWYGLYLWMLGCLCWFLLTLLEVILIGLCIAVLLVDL